VVPAEHLVGFEPDADMFHEAVRVTRGTGITIIKALDSLDSGAFSTITCLETVEHLVDKELDALFTNIKRLLAHDGQVVISVPIETGVPALLKNVFRILRGHVPDNLTFRYFWRMVCGASIPRSTPERREHGQYIYSHMGFNHCQFEETLKKHVRIKDIRYSPLAVAGSMLNNTVLYAGVHK
jgi:SAM-dependent methyltransferase